MSFSFSGRVQLSKCAKNFTLPDEEALETIGRALADKSYLAPLLPHEMSK